MGTRTGLLPVIRRPTGTVHPPGTGILMGPLPGRPRRPNTPAPSTRGVTRSMGTAMATITHAAMVTVTGTPTATATATVTGTPTATATATGTGTPTATATATGRATATVKNGRAHV